MGTIRVYSLEFVSAELSSSLISGFSLTFDSIVAMNSFGKHMGDAVTDSTKKGWLTGI